ncbi:MAG TPA: DUF2127 domain-containing protein [Candidatus Udaeobacter sp.]|nr:DUF2127 domain-containing protein [Candidatus Udaeobacter sp.]
MRKPAGHIARVRTSGVHRWFAAFFAFGAMMCALTVSLLLFPGSALDSLWLLNPDARLAFESLGYWSLVLMLAVGTACFFAAIGLWRTKPWGTWLALIILSINMLGDLTSVFVRHDYRGLIGVPVAGTMIFFLLACDRHSKSLRTR